MVTGNRWRQLLLLPDIIVALTTLIKSLSSNNENISKRDFQVLNVGSDYFVKISSKPSFNKWGNNFIHIPDFKRDTTVCQSKEIVIWNYNI